MLFHAWICCFHQSCVTLYILHSRLLKEKHSYGKRCVRYQIAAKASLCPKAGEIQSFVYLENLLSEQNTFKAPSVANRQNLPNTVEKVIVQDSWDSQAERLVTVQSTGPWGNKQLAVAKEKSPLWHETG